ncbi:MAG: hypothetical protein L0177_10995 [Chloroflexi bacterium]|nr:hypothetical protein [Chloroflexota bacterium]
MTTQRITDNSPGTALFPEYATLYDLIAREARGLTDAQLDWESDQWEWAKWSIRRQLSHMASLLYRWLIVRWGQTLFPGGNHGVADLEGIASSPSDRQLDERKYRDLPVILDTLKGGIDLCQRVLSERSVGFLRSHTIPHQRSPQWVLMFKAHPTGIEPRSEAQVGTISLEATLRHMYFEETTHLYNIQRLKRAQGLKTAVEAPRVGYWILDGWDRSEAV